MPDVSKTQAHFKLRPKQKLFVETDAPFSFYVGGLGAGKTFAGAVRALMMITKWPGSLGLIGAPTFPMLRDTTMRTFFESCPAALLKSYNKNEMKAYFINGSEVLFRSMDDPDKARGLNLSWFWLDEAPFCGYYAWKVLKARAGRQDPKKFPRVGFATGTPKGKDGFWEDFEHNPQKGHFLVRASTWENAMNLPEGYVEGLGYTGNFALQEIEGRFEAFEGLVYQFNAEPGPSSHIMPSSIIFRLPSGSYLVPDYDEIGQRVGWRRVAVTRNDKKEEAPDEPLPEGHDVISIKQVLGGVDWGFTNPAVCNIYLVDRDERVYQVYEFYQRRTSRERVFLPEIVKTAKEYEVETMYCDPAEPQSISDLRYKMDEEQVNCSVKQAENEIINGIHTVRNFLAVREDGTPGFLLDKNLCKNTINEFGSYQYPTKDVRDRNPTEVPIPQNDHSLGCLRYILFSAFGAGRGGSIPSAATNSSTLDPLREAERLLKQEDEIMVIRGQAASSFLRDLDKQGLARDGLWRPDLGWG